MTTTAASGIAPCAPRWSFAGHAGARPDSSQTLHPTPPASQKRIGRGPDHTHIRLDTSRNPPPPIARGTVPDLKSP
jgi:hypothetical protein